MKKNERTRTAPRILSFLAQNKPSSKWELASVLNKSYGNVHATIQRLLQLYLIEVKYEKPSAKNPKIKVEYYSLAFSGLIEILKYLNDEEIDLVVDRYSDKWLIFAEWPWFLKRGGEGGKGAYAVVKLVSLQYNSLFSDVVPEFTEKQIKAFGPTFKQWKKIHDGNVSFVLENTKQECTDLVLGLKSLFGSRKSLLFKAYLARGEESMLIESAKRDMKILVNNPRIREYVDKRFKQEKALHQLVDTIEAHWEKMKSNITTP